jgi:hypothetical protein
MSVGRGTGVLAVELLGSDILLSELLAKAGGLLGIHAMKHAQREKRYGRSAGSEYRFSPKDSVVMYNSHDSANMTCPISLW